MTKEDILHHFQDINFFYNDSRMYDDLSRMLDELIAENKREWFPVLSGELSKIGQRVLATIETYDDGRAVRETIYDKYGFMCGNATAWMPLPEPYKGVTNE